MSLRLRLLLAQTPLAIALVIVGCVGVSTIASLGRSSGAILRENYRSVLAIQRMQAAIERLDDEAFLAAIGAASTDGMEAEEHRHQFNVELEACLGNITEVGERDAVESLRALWQRYEATFENRPTQAEPADARAYLVGQLEPAAAAVRQQADLVLAMNQDAMVRKSEAAQAEAARMDTMMLLAALAALFGGAVASSLVTRRLLQPFELLARTVSRIGDGDFETRVDVGGRDEVARLATDINAMATRLSQYRSSSLGELLRAQRSAQAAIDSLPDPVMIFDLGGALLNTNRAAEAALGIRPDGPENSALVHLSPDIQKRVDHARSHVLSGKGLYAARGFDEAVRTVTTAGERYLLPCASPVYSDEGAVAGAVVVLQDVTRLRRVDELRNDLVSTVAHELRTPLTSLRMAVHLCIEQAGGPLSEAQADLLHAAREDCERLQGMVDELLDLARIQSGQIELRRAAYVPGDLVDAAIEAHRASATNRSLTLRKEILPGLPAIYVDRERILIAIANLLVNALRHAPDGGAVTVRAFQDADAVRIEVVDTGPGISIEHQAAVFDRFSRVPGSASGTGLGLSIARDIVDAHDGRIGVDSTPGHGATFWMELPIARESR